VKFFNSIVNIQFDLLCCSGSNSVTYILEVKGLGLDGVQLDGMKQSTMMMMGMIQFGHISAQILYHEAG